MKTYITRAPGTNVAKPWLLILDYGDGRDKLLGEYRTRFSARVSKRTFKMWGHV